VNQPAAVGRHFWAVVRASAVRRLGRPLIVAHALLALVGVAVVAISVVVMSW